MPVLIPPSAARTQLGLNAAGIIVENFDPAVGSAAAAMPTQQVLGVLLGLRAGDSVTGILIRCQTAAAAANPTLARFGIADSTGKILAISGDQSAAANWVNGASPQPFAAPYTVLTDGGYYAAMVVNGVWGTPPTVVRGGNQSGNATGSLAGKPLRMFNWNSQTDLPIVGNSMTITSGSPNPMAYMAFYGTAVT